MLEVRDLSVEFDTPGGIVRAVDSVTFSMRAGEAFGIVGESGSGKSVMAQSIMRLLPSPPARISGGSVLLDRRDLLNASSKEIRKVRGSEISMIFQEPVAALNPLMRVGDQIAEAITAHNPSMSQRAVESRTLDLLESVQIPDAKQRIAGYPHEFSGGMAQRVSIAIGMANNPRLVIADEPTTALDVTVQAQVLQALESAREKTGAAIMLITHDMGLIAEFTDRVVVMYSGRVVETGPVSSVLTNPQHPYTAALLGSLPKHNEKRERLISIPGQPPNLIDIPSGCAFHPRCHVASGRSRCIEVRPQLVSIGSSVDQTVACHFPEDCSVPGEEPSRHAPTGESLVDGKDRPGQRAEPILEVEELVVGFPVRSKVTRRVIGNVHAVDGVSLSLNAGETLALVGESGCGKSTTARAIIGLIKPASGRILLSGQDITTASARDLRLRRRQMQLVFQDTYSSLNPKSRIGNIIAEPFMQYHTRDRAVVRQKVSEVLERIGLDPSYANRYPHEFSGGQRQRIGIARALIVEPSLLLLDEPVSALDGSIQAQILNLLKDLQAQLGLAYLVIAHDLSVVRHIADRVAVMYLGKIVESGSVDDIFSRSTHPYTQALLSAVPIADPTMRWRSNRIVLSGELPKPTDPPSGCRFRTRCWKAEEICGLEEPELMPQDRASHVSACYFGTQMESVNSPAQFR